MDMKNWNVDKTQIAAQQEALKKSMNFSYIGHGPRATGFLAKEFKRKPGLYARCVQWMQRARKTAFAAICTGTSALLKANCP